MKLKLLVNFNDSSPALATLFCQVMRSDKFSNMLYVFLSSGNCYSLEFDNPERPECNNLLSIYQLILGKTKEVFE